MNSPAGATGSAIVVNRTESVAPITTVGVLLGRAVAVDSGVAVTRGVYVGVGGSGVEVGVKVGFGGLNAMGTLSAARTSA